MRKKTTLLYDPDLLRALIDSREQTQKMRLAYNNRLKAIERGADSAPKSTVAVLQRLHDQFRDIEDGIDANIEALADGIEIIDQMRCVRGIGKILAARLVSMIDISRADHVSSLWRYAGYGVDEEGKADRPKKGEKRKDNKRLKVACYVVAISFLKQKPPYTDIYYRAKEYYEASRSEWTKMHIHRAALRKMMKVFLQHLWLRWRLLEGLPISEPYVHNKMGHNHIYKPEEFGWPAL